MPKQEIAWTCWKQLHAHHGAVILQQVAVASFGVAMGCATMAARSRQPRWW
jgi:hypothetical protein